MRKAIKKQAQKRHEEGIEGKKKDTTAVKTTLMGI